jgi:hypothetical protein
LWRRLWALPVAAWWREQMIEPAIVAVFVRLVVAKPEHASAMRLMSELGLTPASLVRLRLVVEQPEPAVPRVPDPYAHLKKKLRVVE